MMKAIATAVIITTLLVSGSLSKAQTWTQPGPAVYSNNWQDGFSFILSGVQSNCSFEPTQFFVKWGGQNASQLYALVLTAFVSGKLLAVDYSCDNTTTPLPPARPGAVTTNIDVR
jgi:hypothetical protein